MGNDARGDLHTIKETLLSLIQRLQTIDLLEID